MTKRRPKSVLYAPSGSAIVGNIDVMALGDDPVGDVAIFAGAGGKEALRQRLRDEVETEVAAMLEAIRECDAFDVIELMRLRELPIVPVVALMDSYDGSAAAIDLVSLVCLSRPTRMPGDNDREATNPERVIDDLHARATRLLRLATFTHNLAALTAEDPLARLASEYQTYLVNVRKFQYDSVQEEHENALFDRPEIDAILRKHLGFTFRDFTTVRSDIQERYSHILKGLRGETGGLLMRCQAERRDPSEQEIQAFRQSISDIMFLPGERASFTMSDIAAESALGPAQVQAVLDAYSIGFGDSGDAAAAVALLLRGVNPLATRCLVRDAAGNYLMTGSQIGTDSFRAMAESALKADRNAWKRYDRTRAEVSETTALAASARALKTPPAYSNLKYYAPKKDQDATALNAACSSPQVVGDQTECDGLFIIDDVAISVEVKGRTIAGAARRGDRARLAREIKGIFGEGARQARRVEQLISQNHGLWLADGSG